MLEKFEDVLYGPQGGILSGLIHLFQDYLPVSGITRSWEWRTHLLPRLRALSSSKYAPSWSGYAPCYSSASRES